MFKSLETVWLKIKADPIKEFEDSDSMALSFEGNASEEVMAKLVYLFLEANEGIRSYVFSMFRFTPAKYDSRSADRRIQAKA